MSEAEEDFIGDDSDVDNQKKTKKADSDEEGEEETESMESTLDDSDPDERDYEKLVEAQERMCYKGPFDVPPCRPRTAQLAIPNKRTILDLYRDFRHIMCRKRAARIRRIVRDLNMIPIEELADIVKNRKLVDDQYEKKKKYRKKHIKKVLRCLEDRRRKEGLDFIFKQLQNYVSKLILKRRCPTITSENTRKLIDCAYFNICATLGVVPYTNSVYDIYIFRNLAQEVAKFVEKVLFKMHQKPEFATMRECSSKFTEQSKKDQAMIKRGKRVAAMKDRIRKHMEQRHIEELRSWPCKEYRHEMWTPFWTMGAKCLCNFKHVRQVPFTPHPIACREDFYNRRKSEKVKEPCRLL